MTTVSVLGSGIMATALSFPLADNGHDVRLVGTHLDRDIIDSIKKTGVHPGLDRKVPETVRAYQLEEAREAFEGAEVALSGVNSFGLRWGLVSRRACWSGSTSRGAETATTTTLRPCSLRGRWRSYR